MIFQKCSEHFFAVEILTETFQKLRKSLQTTSDFSRINVSKISLIFKNLTETFRKLLKNSANI